MNRRKLWVIERKPTKFHEWKPWNVHFTQKDASRTCKILGKSYRVRIYIPREAPKP